MNVRPLVLLAVAGLVAGDLAAQAPPAPTPRPTPPIFSFDLNGMNSSLRMTPLGAASGAIFMGSNGTRGEAGLLPGEHPLPEMKPLAPDVWTDTSPGASRWEYFQIEVAPGRSHLRFELHPQADTPENSELDLYVGFNMVPTVYDWDAASLGAGARERIDLGKNWPKPLRPGTLVVGVHRGNHRQDGDAKGAKLLAIFDDVGGPENADKPRDDSAWTSQDPFALSSACRNRQPLLPEPGQETMAATERFALKVDQPEKGFFSAAPAGSTGVGPYQGRVALATDGATTVAFHVTQHFAPVDGATPGKLLVSIRGCCGMDEDPEVICVLSDTPGRADFSATIPMAGQWTLLVNAADDVPVSVRATATVPLVAPSTRPMECTGEMVLPAVGRDATHGTASLDPEKPVQLKDGETVSFRIGPGVMHYFRYSPTSPTGRLRIEMDQDLGDQDLYVRRAGPPTEREWDFRPWLGGAPEVVWITTESKPVYEPGNWFLGVRGYSQGSYTIRAELLRDHAAEVRLARPKETPIWRIKVGPGT